MLTRKFVNIYGVVGISVMAVLLLAIYLKLVPQSMYLPLFVLSAAIFLGRVVLRMLLVRKERQSLNDQGTSSGTGETMDRE